jgi:hypothetical protein
MKQISLLNKMACDLFGWSRHMVTWSHECGKLTNIFPLLPDVVKLRGCVLHKIIEVLLLFTLQITSYCKRLVVYPLLHMFVHMDDNHLSLGRMELRVLVVFVKPEMSVSLKLNTAPHILSQRVFGVCLCV